MKFNYKPILFVICLLALIAFQRYVVMPLLYDVASSDLFLEDDENNFNQNSMADEMLKYAFDQCNNYIAEDLDTEISASFTLKPINAWSIGGNQYVVNADIDLAPADAQSFSRRYVCRIKYTSDSTDLSEITNSDNWSVDGVSGLDNL